MGILQSLIPAGVSLPYRGCGTLPEGWLSEDGSLLSRTLYALLFKSLVRSGTGNITVGAFNISARTGGLTFYELGWYASGPGIALGAKIVGFDGSFNPVLDIAHTASSTGGTFVFSPYPLGDGSTTFAIPDSRGHTDIGSGQHSGLTDRKIGAKTGLESHTLTTGEIPAHNHVQGAPQDPGNFGFDPTGYGAGGGTTGTFSNTNPFTKTDGGGGGSHNNMQPSLAAQKIIKY